MNHQEEQIPAEGSEPEEALAQQPTPAKRAKKWKRWVVGGGVLGVVGGLVALPFAYPLKSALKDKNFAYAQVLVILGVDVNAKSASGKSLLKEAFDAYEPRVVQFLMEQPGIDTSAWTPLTLAVLCNDCEQVKQLLKAGQDVNEPDSFGHTPLYYAVERECMAITEELLYSPELDLCSKHCHGLKLLKMCDNADIRFKISSAARRQLNRLKVKENKSYYDAKETRDARWVSLCLMEDSYRLSDFSSIEKAVLANDVEALKDHLRYRVEDVTSSSGNPTLRSALEWAAFAGHKECVEVLISAGASIDASTSSGRRLFMAAVEHGDAETMRLVLMHTFNLNEVAQDAMNALARRGEARGLALFIEAGVSPVNLNSDTGSSIPLNNAEQCGQVACVELLMQHGARPIEKDDNGNNVFHRAVTGGFPELVKFYAQHYISSVNEKNDAGDTPLTLAVKENNAEVLQALLALPGIDLNLGDADGRTALALAETQVEATYADILRQAGASNQISTEEARAILNRKGYTEDNYLSFFRSDTYNRLDESVLSLLAQSGWNLNATDTEGRTPLTYTIANVYESVAVNRMKQLLALQAVDVNAPDAKGETPLTLSVSKGKESYVKLLLECDKVDKNKPAILMRDKDDIFLSKCDNDIFLSESDKADKNKPNQQQRTPLMVAALVNNEEMVKLLHQAGADVNAATDEGYTALMLCVQAGKPDMVKTLLGLSGIDVNKKPKEHNAIELAVEADNADIVKALLTAPGVDVNAVIQNGRTWLHMAAAGGKVEAIKAILSVPGVNVNLADAEGHTALYLAAEQGYTRTVEALLAVPDIQVNVADAQGSTALDIATRNKHHNCVQLLTKFADSVPTDVADKFADYLKSAESGNARSQYIVGLCYLKGSGVDLNGNKAAEWFRKAAEQGHVNAQHALAKSLYHGLNMTPQPAEAYQWYRKVADTGRADAQYMVAEILREGEHTTKNTKEACTYYRLAAEQNHVDAMYELANCYAEGIGAKKNPKEAFAWYKAAAEQNHADAMYELAQCYSNATGTTRDEGEAVKWYRKAADQGDGYAQFYLALCYEKGKGVEQDLFEAKRWYERAAENDVPEAIYNLGCCYYHANGTYRDYEKAYELFQRVADSDIKEAWFNLGCCYYHGHGTGVDYEKAVKWYRKSADKGFAEAMYNLGCCYFYGQGVKKDKKQSNKWFRKAAEKGHPEAAKFIGH